MRVPACLALLLLALYCSAETVVTRARIAEVTPSGYLFAIGTESVEAKVERGTKFWRNLKPAKREDFSAGEQVAIRLAMGTRLNELREIADVSTGEILAAIRKDVISCTVVKVDAKTMIVQLDGRGEFVYRHSDKSDIRLGGRAVTFNDLRKDQRLYIKGRLLPSLDTWIVSATDVRPPSASTKAQPQEITSSGKLKGVIDLHQPQFSLVDLYVNERLVHVVYTPKTKVKLEGAKAEFADIQRGLWAHVLWRRDQFGRMIASQIELFHGKRP